MMIGSTSGHYRIEEALGRDGMGVVYRARDERLRRPVALKVLPEEACGHAERRARILAEARSAAALNHPAITTVYDEAGEQLFIVMELVRGQTLRAMISQKPVDTLSQSLWRIFSRFCRFYSEWFQRCWGRRR